MTARRIIILLIIAKSPFIVQADDQPKPAADPMLGNEAGQVRDDNGLKMKLVWCPPGSFRIERRGIVVAPDGTKTEMINTGRDLLTGYWLGKYEVTQGEWKTIMQ